MIDIVQHIEAVHRTVTGDSGGKECAVTLSRGFDTAIEDVWEAITTAERLARWFLPVTGDLRPGGRYQLEGNAGGEILRCEPPRLLRVTWVFGESSSEVEVRLAAGPDDTTRFELEHTAPVDPAMWAQYGPGAVGVGWDLVLLGLALHVSPDGAAAIEDITAWQESAEARQFVTRSSASWGVATAASGVDDAEVASMVANTTQFYAPEPEPESDSAS